VDRMLIAQTQAESIPILSHDAVLDTYGVRRQWVRIDVGFNIKNE